MKWNKIIKDNKLLPDFINVVLGLVVIVLFVLVIIFPTNNAIMASLLIVAGIMNVTNGYRKASSQGQKGMGIFFGIVGIIIVAFGLYYLRIALA